LAGWLSAYFYNRKLRHPSCGLFLPLKRLQHSK
jgi:hypothetical protein